MALKDQLEAYQEPIPSDALDVEVEIGKQVLQMKVSRRDLSPKLDRDIRNKALADPDYDQAIDEDDSQMPLWKVEALATRIEAVVHSYRVFKNGADEREIANTEWILGLTAQDVLDLGDHFWDISRSVFSKLNPGNLPSVEESSSG